MIEMGVPRRLVGYCLNLRVPNWRAYMGMAILGFAQNIDVSSLDPKIYEDSIKLVISVSLFLAFAFSINNSFDRDCDAEHDEKSGKNPIVRGLISFEESLIFSSVIAIVGLALTYLWFNPLNFMLYLALMMLGGAYSTPPLRLKSTPILDLISHGLFFGALLYLYGASASGGLNLQTTIISSSLFLYSVILELRNHLEDYHADLNSGLRTTVCWLGYERARNLLKFMLVLHVWVLILITLHGGYPILALSSGVWMAALLRFLRLDFNYYLRFMDLWTGIVYVSLLCLSQITGWGSPV